MGMRRQVRPDGGSVNGNLSHGRANRGQLRSSAECADTNQETPVKRFLAAAFLAAIATAGSAATARTTSFSSTACQARAYDEAGGTHTEGLRYSIAGNMTMTNSSTVYAYALCPVPIVGTSTTSIYGGKAIVHSYSANSPVSCTVYVANPYAYFFNTQSINATGIQTLSFPHLSAYSSNNTATMVCRMPPKLGSWGYSHLYSYSFDTP